MSNGIWIHGYHVRVGIGAAERIGPHSFEMDFKRKGAMQLCTGVFREGGELVWGKEGEARCIPCDDIVAARDKGAK